MNENEPTKTQNGIVRLSILVILGDKQRVIR